MTSDPKIIYTHTDEAPALATYSLLPIVEGFLKSTGIAVETRDISLSGRILANFADHLAEGQRINDDLAELGQLAKTPAANIIKLPNISASIPQLKAAIKELQAKGYALPEYPDEPRSDAERDVKARYDKVKGSAVNPVLREGNSDRRAPGAVKEYARKHPHRMREWSGDCKAHVASMQDGDFRANERSTTVAAATTVSIQHTGKDGQVTKLKSGIALQEGEVVDATFMSKKKLESFLAAQVAEAKEQGVLFSLHMKATMMKVSDPIIFGYAVRAFFAPLFDKHGDALAKAGANPRNGFGDILAKVAAMAPADREAIEKTIADCYADGPALAMVDSDKGITNLHVPSDVIIDASMPVVVRDGGQMWNADGKLQECKAVIPDRCYAGVYQAVIDDCKANGAFDPATIGSIPNVGLMAKKAEEYGSHDKTFEMPSDGTIKVVDDSGKTLLQHDVEKGDVWRMCQVKDDAVRDWVKLAVARATATKAAAVFWLDETRAHDAQLIKKVRQELPKHATDGLEIVIKSPVDATTFSLERMRAGKDTISVTGNVLRDYLTDLFPIIEVGTSAKMLSIVPLMQGGGLFETGAGGSAPKHVQQFEKENHLRWDSLGEFLALGASLEHIATRFDSPVAAMLAKTCDEASAGYLLNNKSPSRKVHELDNRGSHYFFATYWAEALSKQSEFPELADRFAPVASALRSNEDKIVAELNGAQGSAADVGGYFRPDPDLAGKAMRPSATLNAIVDGL